MRYRAFPDFNRAIASFACDIANDSITGAILCSAQKSSIVAVVAGDPSGDDNVVHATLESIWTSVKSTPRSVGGLTHFEVKTEPESRPPSEPSPSGPSSSPSSRARGEPTTPVESAGVRARTYERLAHVDRLAMHPYADGARRRDHASLRRSSATSDKVSPSTRTPCGP